MLKDLLLKNRSYRGFDESRLITRAELLDLVEHARLTPSSVNMQPLVYVLVYEAEEVAKVQALTNWAKALSIELPHKGKNPTAFLVICQDLRIAKQPEAYTRDVGIVAQTMLLRAVEMGLGGCMIGNFYKQKLSEVLELEEHYYPHLVIALGKPDEKIVLYDIEKEESTRYSRDEKDVHYVPKRKTKDLIIEKL